MNIISKEDEIMYKPEILRFGVILDDENFLVYDQKYDNFITPPPFISDAAKMISEEPLVQRLWLEEYVNTNIPVLAVS